MKRSILLLACSIFLASCTAPIRDFTKTQYINPSFSKETLRSGGLALLPITAGQGQEGYRRPLGDYLNQNLKAAINDSRILTWEQTMDSLNRCSKVKDYEDLITGYKQTSILSRGKVREIASALGTRYALLCSLLDYSESKNINYNFLTGLETSKTANVSAHCLVIDLENGDVMQEIIGQVVSEAAGFSHNQGYEEYAKIMAYSILSQLPGSELPPLVIKDRNSFEWNSW
ncbi:MAG TPA: hypothetical protein VHO03_05720 [Ignavibacteriales bacterium]|nr:hypothetical protein [Ignavibacteriales bacterium]